MAAFLELVYWLKDNWEPMLKVIGAFWLVIEAFVCLFLPSNVGSLTKIGMKVDAVMDFFKIPYRKPKEPVAVLDMTEKK